MRALTPAPTPTPHPATPVPPPSRRAAHPELRRRGYVGDGEIEWHGLLPGAPDWSEESRLLAFTLRAPRGGGGLYVAFNSGHLPLTLALPTWPGRAWRLVADSGRVAPYDVLVADEVLSEGEVAAAHAAMGMWTLASAAPLLPWSCIVLESVPEGAAAARPSAAAAGEEGEAAAAYEAALAENLALRQQLG